MVVDAGEGLIIALRLGDRGLGSDGPFFVVGEGGGGEDDGATEVVDEFLQDVEDGAEVGGGDGLNFV